MRAADNPFALDETDRAAFRSWFIFLADAQFERTDPDVTDCAALVRHAYREALRAHSPQWHQRNRLTLPLAFPDVRHPPPPSLDVWPLFRIAANPDRFGEFADASTIVKLNARARGRNVRAVRPGDLLYFRQASGRDHLMIFVGGSRFDPSRQDWIVYHTGPDGGWKGEVRKVALSDLLDHPSGRWRPSAGNPAFIGIFRLAILDPER